MLALNCGFGPKDIHDLTWQDIEGERVTLPRGKTGVCQRDTDSVAGAECDSCCWLSGRAAVRTARKERAARHRDHGAGCVAQEDGVKWR
jgi:hypothetical protein